MAGPFLCPLSCLCDSCRIAGDVVNVSPWFPAALHDLFATVTDGFMIRQRAQLAQSGHLEPARETQEWG